ncbi:AraC family transcriptional regulator [Polaromonas jejuensis]|uniref:Helix-turn-helix domain-containing protein n=1 Tax=Polaromonas jejuensis TaxID=457502 RepID=A0ABW0Q7D9_9BURK
MSSVYLRDFSDDYRADLNGPFDFLLIEISYAFIDRTRDDMRGACSRGLERVVARVDNVLGHLAMALLPALDRPTEAEALFVDQLGLAIGTHLVGSYGGSTLPNTRKSRRLSELQESRAKELIRNHLDGSISVSDIADTCNMSRSYFIRAFCETTGQTPYQWLLSQRVDSARKLLTNSTLSLADIAFACGFADQSHFTRVFTQTLGTPPGRWRRSHS